MKTIKLTLLTFAILAFTTNSFSQYEENNKAKEEYKNKSKHAVGLAAGFSTGYGLSYQYTPNKKVSTISGDTPRLSNDRLGNCFGGR